MPGALEFFNYADEKGIKIFYISNRSDSSKLYTIENLKALGLPQVSEESVLLKTTTSNKTERRAKIKKDYEVILLMGDNLTDFTEEFANRGNDLGQEITEKNKALFGTKYVVFANPMYGEWIKAIMKNKYDYSDKEKYELRKTALDIKK